QQIVQGRRTTPSDDPITDSEITISYLDQIKKEEINNDKQIDKFSAGPGGWAVNFRLHQYGMGYRSLAAVEIMQTVILPDTSPSEDGAEKTYDFMQYKNRCAILAGNKNIKFTNVIKSAKGRHKDQDYHIINGAINILAEDFNTNINPENNRISHLTFQNNPSRQQLLDLTKDFIDTSEIAGESPFLAYFLNIQIGRSMATCIDYIFIEAEYSSLIKKLTLRHEHVVSKRSDRRVSRQRNWDLCKLKIQTIIRAFKKPKALEGRALYKSEVPDNNTAKDITENLPQVNQA
ncbi:22985_t:CDS:2, partial [Gigaspora rosea]